MKIINFLKSRPTLIVLLVFLIVIPVLGGIAILNSDSENPPKVKSPSGTISSPRQKEGISETEEEINNKNIEDPVYSDIPGEDRYLILERAKSFISIVASPQDRRASTQIEILRKKGIVTDTLADRVYAETTSDATISEIKKRPLYRSEIISISTDVDLSTGERIFLARVDSYKVGKKTPDMSWLITVYGLPEKAVISNYQKEPLFLNG